ncbi:MAG: phosphotransferase [Actinomycetota bacterium]
MPDAIHDDEVDTSEAVVAALIADQCPQWSRHHRQALHTSGTDNAMWALRAPGASAPQLVMRLPRMGRAVAGLETELALLPHLAGGPGADGGLTGSEHPVHTPTLRHAGEPTADYPYPWAVFGWLPGVDAWSARTRIDPRGDALAEQLASTVAAIGALGASGEVPVGRRPDGQRGGLLAPLLDRLARWLDDPAWRASSLIDVAAVRRRMDEARELPDHDGEPEFVHGDLIPGNLLVDGGRLSAVIDWSGAAFADPAQDLAPAWSMLAGRGRDRFREHLEADDARWARGRVIELEHAVGAVLYYRPRGHALADVMDRTLGRILTD